MATREKEKEKKKRMKAKGKRQEEQEEVNLGCPWSLAHNRDHDHHNGTNRKARPYNHGLLGTPS